MIVCYFNVKGISVFPVKAYPPLIVYPDAELPFAIALQGLQPVAWRNSKVFQVPGLVKVQEFAPGCPLDRTKPRHILIVK
jgi:hypothetical protein